MYKFKVKDLSKKDKELKKLMKRCKKCGEMLLINRFNNKKSCLDGREGFCKTCKYKKSLKYTKKCLNCNKEFVNRKNVKFCSLKCSAEYKENKITCKCDYCKKEITKTKYEYDRSKHHFCSKECQNKWYSENMIGENSSNWQGGNIKIKCDYCNKEYSIIPSKLKQEHHFCSRECMGKWQSENLSGENSYTWKGEYIYYKCEYCGEICKQTKTQYNKHKHHYCSKECANKHHGELYNGKNHPNWKGGDIKLICEYCSNEFTRRRDKSIVSEHCFCSIECKGKWWSENMRGKNHPSYNPNITDEEREKGRRIDGYIDFRKQVFERDDYTCQCCKKKGNIVTLNAHHLNSYNWCKEHRTDELNGITLCENCHKEFHSIYGKGNNTIEQFREFLYNKYLQTKDIKYLVALEDTDIRKYAMKLEDKEG